MQEGDPVTKGQLIGRLDDSNERAALNQAEAAYQAAQSLIPQAQINLNLQRLSTDAAIQRAQAGVASQTAKARGAAEQVGLISQTLTQQQAQAGSQLAAVQSQAAQASAQVTTAAANLNTVRQGVETARQAAAAATATINAALANAERANADERRYARLLQQDAVTRQQYDTVVAAARTANAQLASTRSQAAQASSQVAQARSNVAQAQGQLQAAREQAAAARAQVGVSRAALAIASANQGQIPIQQTNASSSQAQAQQAQADLADALAGRQQITLRQKQVQTTEIQARQQRAALENARTNERDTYIYAPSDGRVVRKSVNPGAALTPGQSIVTMTQGNDVWVTANLKETQLRGVKPGEEAEVSVDAYPGRIFKGRIQSINEATGASLALLPPDNATGNFTKVVQRIPIRINLVPAKDSEDSRFARASDFSNLRQGMSVTATIDLNSGSTKGSAE